MSIYNAFFKPKTRSQRGESPGRLLSFHRIFFPTWLLIFRPYVPVSSVVLQGNITEFKALDGRHETLARQFCTRNIQWKSNATGFSFIGAFRLWRKKGKRRESKASSNLPAVDLMELIGVGGFFCRLILHIHSAHELARVNCRILENFKRFMLLWYLISPPLGHLMFLSLLPFQGIWANCKLN